MRFSVLLICSVIVGLTGCATSSAPSTSAPASVSSTASTAVASNTKAAEYNTQLGIGYLRQGNYDRAKEKLLLALQQDPNSSSANSAMAYFLEKTGDTQQAETYYQKAVSLAANPGPAQNNYGTFLCRQGQYAAALTQFDQAASDPYYLTPANSLENAGLCALLIPDQDKAISYFQAALQKNPNMSTSILQLGEIYYSKGDFTQSYKYLAQYLKGNEPTAEALWLGIQLAYERGDSSSANSYGLLLKSQFASSQQYQDYLKLKTSKGS